MCQLFVSYFGDRSEERQGVDTGGSSLPLCLRNVRFPKNLERENTIVLGFALLKFFHSWYSACSRHNKEMIFIPDNIFLENVRKRVNFVSYFGDLARVAPRRRYWWFTRFHRLEIRKYR